jgi:YjbE family integral membrane protein
MTDLFTTERLLAALNIVFIDILLAGDNAVLIALAVQRLSPQERKVGIAVGSLGAVVLRVALTFVATQMLGIPFLKIVGGGLILWIALKLLSQSGANEEGGEAASNLWQAMWMILVADVTMSLDNIIAIAGAAKGHMDLVIFGLLLSIPFVVFASNWLSRLMDRYPIIVLIGAAILGKVGAEMILTDPWLDGKLHLPHWVHWAIEAACALGIVFIGRALFRGKKSGHQPPPALTGSK